MPGGDRAGIVAARPAASGATGAARTASAPASPPAPPPPGPPPPPEPPPPPPPGPPPPPPSWHGASQVPPICAQDFPDRQARHVRNRGTVAVQRFAKPAAVAAPKQVPTRSCA